MTFSKIRYRLENFYLLHHLHIAALRYLPVHINSDIDEENAV